MKVLIFSLLLLGCMTTPKRQVASVDRANIVKVSSEFEGLWRPVTQKNLHPWMKGDVEISHDTNEPALLIKGGKIMNSPWSELIVDPDGISYQVTADMESFLDGTKLVIATIWRKADRKENPDLDPISIAIIDSVYQLKDKDTLIFEKYGYSSGEKNGKFSIEAYSKNFPKNYHTVYKRVR